jgi:tRNA/rRNA methyltransferase
MAEMQANQGQSGPAIVLVEPQLGENIGTAARAMANFGLADLRVVNPREGWPNEKALSAASRAPVIERVRLFPTLAAAISDLQFVYATTAREREVSKPVAGPRRAAEHMRQLTAAGAGVGVLFGRERTGLTNEEISLADEIVTLPVDPMFTSVNVAQAVLVVAYEWRLATLEGKGAGLPFLQPADRRATKDELLHLFLHLEGALDDVGYFRPLEKRPHMVEALRALFQRAALSEQEARTLRGIIAALERRPTRPRVLPDGTVTTERGKFE